MAHGLTSAGAQASAAQARGASASQLSAINHRLAGITTALAAISQQDAHVAVLVGRGVEGLSIAQLLDQVDGALRNTVTPNSITTCLTVQRSAGQPADGCRG
jgi:hypothetical protein